MTVLMPNGKPVNWKAEWPKASDMVLWQDAAGHTHKASFYTACHMERLDRLAMKRFGQHIVVIQSDWNTGVSASAGTHDYDSVWDLYIPGVDWWVMQMFFRRNGFPGWYRHPPLFGYHYHGFSLPQPEGVVVSDNFRSMGLKVGKYVDGGYSLYGHQITSSQIEDVYNHAFGLSNQHTQGSDRSWWPKDINATAFNLDKFCTHNRKLAA